MIELREISTGKKILIKKVFCNDVKNPKACYIRTLYWKSDSSINGGKPVRRKLASERAGRLNFYGIIKKNYYGNVIEFSSFSIPEGWEIIPETASKVKLR